MADIKNLEGMIDSTPIMKDYADIESSKLPEFQIDSKIPEGPVAEKWTNYKAHQKLVNPANKRHLDIIVVGTGLAGASAASTLGEMGFNVYNFCIQDSPRRAHSIAAQGGINAAKNYQNDGDSVYRLFYDTVKGGDFRSREANVYRLAEVSNNIIDQCVAQGVPFAREYGGLLANRSFGGAQVSRTFYAKGQTGQQLLLGAYASLNRQIKKGTVKSFNRREMLDIVMIDGRARGVIMRNLVTGELERYSAHAVVLATGDWGNNQDMRDYFVPWANEFMSFYTTMDAAGNVGNTGDGHLMGLWAGAHMELGPHAPMTHHMGGPLGVDGYLQLNINGERFMNEDIPGQNIADQLSRVPAGPNPASGANDLRSWQIFDSKWPTEIDKMPDGHGYVNHFIPAEEVANYGTVLAGFGLGYTTQEMVEGTEGLVVANTLDELAEKCNLPVDAVKASIERYNEMCAAGHDADFGKDPRRLFPVSEPPFYAYPFGSAGMLVLMGGLEVNKKLQPLNAEGAPIEGLYATGNVQGGRYLVEYPVTVAGISLGTALTFGRLAGMNAAGADIEATTQA